MFCDDVEMVVNTERTVCLEHNRRSVTLSHLLKGMENFLVTYLKES